MDERFQRLATGAGLAWPVVILGTVAYGGLASPSFEWPTDPFSVVGATGTTTATVFNAGLVLGGLLAVAFATRLWWARDRAVAGLLALVGGSFAGAGLFPAGGVAHEVFGVGIMLGCWLLLWTAGVLDWRAGETRRGLTVFLLGTATLAVWLPYDFGIESLQFGYAVAELVVFGSAGLWIVWTALRTGGSRRVDVADPAAPG